MRLETPKALFAVKFIDIEKATGVAGAFWEPFQIAYLNNTGRFSVDIKARQVAWSWTAAADAVIDAILYPRTPHIFVSINLDEAQEKIRYAKDIIDAIEPHMRPQIVRDTQTEVELDNGSRISSHPCKPIRGRARARVYLDEMAHYQSGMDRVIYTAALPATTRGDGYIRLGSSPLGATGLLWEIMLESLQKWPGYEGNRHWIPWWSVNALCTNRAEAMNLAPEMPTGDRVGKYAKRAIQEIYANMLELDFQQEYECAWIDESVAWIPWHVIQANQENPPSPCWHATTVLEAVNLVPRMIRALEEGKIERTLAMGVDVGRKHNLTEITVVGKGKTGMMPIRMMVSLANTDYDPQERCILTILKNLPFTAALIDDTGLGGMLAENVARKNGVAQGVTFTNASKELWAVGARVAAERGETPLPVDRDLAYQIHSIKRKISPSKRSVYDTDANEKHHADRFWSWALALAGAGETGSGYAEWGPNPFYGYRG